MIQRSIAIILSILLLCGAVSHPVISAAYAEATEPLTWSFEGGGSFAPWDATEPAGGGSYGMEPGEPPRLDVITEWEEMTEWEETVESEKTTESEEAAKSEKTAESEEITEWEEMTEWEGLIEWEETAEPEEIVAPEAWLGYHEPFAAAPGETLTLALPVQMVFENRMYWSNADAGGNTLPYRAGQTKNDFDQAIAMIMPETRVAILNAWSDDFPLVLEGPSQERYIIANGENAGYAVFENIQIRWDTTPGDYPISIELFWMDADGAGQFVFLTEMIQITGTGDVTLGEYETPTGAIGDLMTVVVPIRYAIGDSVYDTNQGVDGGIVPYAGDTPGMGGAPAAFDQSVTEKLTDLCVSIAVEQPEDFPLDSSALSKERALISDGENRGYAVFEQMPLHPDAEPGEYSMLLDVSWRDASGTPQSKSLITPLNIGYDSSLIVFTWAELRTAVSNAAGPTTIYLGWCVGTTGAGDGWEPGATVNNGTIYMTSDGLSNGTAQNATVTRSDVTIVGRDPRNGQQVQLIGNGNNSQFLLSATGSARQAFAMRDVYMDGRHTSDDGDGCIHTSGTAPRDITLTNCTMIGSEILWLDTPSSDTSGHNSNHVTIYGSDFTVSKSGEIMTVQSGRVDVYGANRWTRNNAITTNSMCWLVAGGYFTLHQGASLIASTKHYFIYDSGLKSYLTIDGYLEVTTNTSDASSHGMNFATQSLDNFTIGSTGHLKVTHKATSATAGYASLYAKTMTLNEGGRLEIYTQAPNTSCIRGNNININSPDFVIMENTNKNRAIFASNTDIEIKTSVINCWKTDGAKYVWNNSDLTPITVKITGSTTSVSNLETGFSGANSGASLPGRNAVLSTAAGGAFDITNANSNIHRLVFTRSGVKIDPETVYTMSAYIAGSVPSGFQGAMEVREYAMAARAPVPALGNGGAPLQTVIPNVTPPTFKTGSNWNSLSTNVSGRVYVICSRTDLLSSDTVDVHVYQDYTEKLELRDVPLSLAFGTVPISGRYRLLDPLGGLGVTVFNSSAAIDWTLYAKARAMSNGTDTLAGALVFAYPGTGVMMPLSSADLAVATKEAGDPIGEKAIAWGPGKGVLLQLDPYAGTIGDTYSSIITWTLVLEDGP